MELSAFADGVNIPEKACCDFWHEKISHLLCDKIKRLTFGRSSPRSGLSPESYTICTIERIYGKKVIFLYKETSKQLTTGSNFVYYYFGYVCLKIRQLFSQFLKEKGEYYDSY